MRLPSVPTSVRHEFGRSRPSRFVSTGRRPLVQGPYASAARGGARVTKGTGGAPLPVKAQYHPPPEPCASCHNPGGTWSPGSRDRPSPPLPYALGPQVRRANELGSTLANRVGYTMCNPLSPLDGHLRLSTTGDATLTPASAERGDVHGSQWSRGSARGMYLRGTWGSIRTAIIRACQLCFGAIQMGAAGEGSRVR